MDYNNFVELARARVTRLRTKVNMLIDTKGADPDQLEVTTGSKALDLKSRMDQRMSQSKGRATPSESHQAPAAAPRKSLF